MPETPVAGSSAETPPGGDDNDWGFRYFLRNVARLLWARPSVRKAVALLVPVALVALVVCRPLFQPWAVALRRRSPLVVAVLLTMALLWLGDRVLAGRRRPFQVLAALLALAWAALLLSPVDLAREASLWKAYQDIERVELDRLPLTDKERIYPLTLVQRIVTDRSTGSHYEYRDMELIQYQDTLYWTSPRIPAGTVNRVTLEDVQGLARVAASKAEVEVRSYDVDFSSGRGMLIIKDLLRWVLPDRLGFVDFFDKELDDDVTYVQTGENEFVQVVDLIDWEGIFPFVVPRFGGAFVISGGPDARIELLTPEQIGRDPRLRGQNLLAEGVTRFYADSWKFNQGLLGWFRKRGVTKITQVPQDTNPQPFTVYFRDVAGHDGLYQFYALEPEGQGAGLSKILLFEPYGYSAGVRVFHYDFEKHGLALVGPARIAETIRGSDLYTQWKQADGGTFVIAESRPHIKDEGGRRRFRWFNSIVTHEQGSNLPVVVIADPSTLEVQWYRGGRVAELSSLAAPSTTAPASPTPLSTGAATAAPPGP